VVHAYHLPIPHVCGQASCPSRLLLGGCIGSGLEIIGFEIGVILIRLDRGRLSICGFLDRLSTGSCALACSVDKRAFDRSSLPSSSNICGVYMSVTGHFSPLSHGTDH
jgi:hypothetical protein